MFLLVLEFPLINPEASVKTQEEAAGYISSGKKYFESGEYEKALDSFRTAAEISPGNADIHTLIGRTLFKLGKTEDAIKAYKKAVELNPTSDAYNELGYIYYAQGDPGSAADAFYSAIKLNPENDDAHAGLGYTYLTIGDIKSAVEQYRILRALDANKADELFYLIFKMRGSEKNQTPR